ncbi:MAG: response regulator [Roseinatronobacter sp.]
MRLLLADDHELVRDTLASFLSRDNVAEIVAVGDLAGALTALDAQTPFDLVMLDYAMPGMDGLAGLTKVLQHPNVPPVALLSGFATATIALDALAQGARGFLTKSMPARALLHAIRLMLEGERFVPVDVMLSFPVAPATPAPEASTPARQMSLTARELEVLVALCNGKTNKEIARDLGLREPTIKLHVKTLYRRLGASNRTQAAMIARSAGLL